MATKKKTGLELTFSPSTKERWKDIETLFGSRGACGGCWCMAWRFGAKDFATNKGEGNKKAFKKIVSSGRVPGIIAYINSQPAGWCSVEPREVFARLEKAKSLAPIDDKPVWSVSCLFVDKQFRKQGVGVALLEAAVKHVKKSGGKIVEGYPSVPSEKLPDPFVWTGTLSGFQKAGFKVVKRPSKSRAIVRFEV